ncbi:MAG: LytTR family DNA-binding domain-containing protein [Flammeovirgaceae bacterium]|nr:LytTR family DNA-binding domain-containing protein [Flammeovirgaceae bacterium]
MKIVIVEDEALAAQKLEQMINRYDESLEILTKLSSVESAVRWFKENESPDLLFLDIHLSDGISFDIFTQVKIKCPVVFTTAYDEYALKAFQLQSIDYLLKPIRFNKFEEAMGKLKEYTTTMKQLEDTDKLDKLINLLGRKGQEYKSRFLVKAGSKIKTIKIEEIAYFISEDKVVFIITNDKKKYSVNHSLDTLEEMLDPKIFFRVNRQFIIHIDSPQNIYPYFKGRLKLDLNPPSDTEIVISSNKAPLFKEWLDQ